MWKTKFEDGTMKLWSPEREETDAPDVLQPFNPSNGGEWSSQAEAEEWAAATIKSFENPVVIEHPVEEPSDTPAGDPAVTAE